MVLDCPLVASVPVFAAVAVVEAVAALAGAQADVAVVSLDSQKELGLGFEELNVVDPVAPSFGLRPASVASSPSFLRSLLVDASAPRS